MNLVLLVTFVSCAHLVTSAKTSIEYDIPENFDVEEVLKNDRLMRNYVNCLLDKGRCTPEGKRLKLIIPDALQNECKKCTERHREIGRKVNDYFLEKKHDWFVELEAKYDPDGTYRKKYNDRLKKEGFTV